MSEHTTRNYMAHGGNELVIGGKLTFLPGATVEGAEWLLGMSQPSTTQIPFFPDSKASTTAALREDFNQFLALLRSSGLMAAEPDPGDTM